MYIAIPHRPLDAGDGWVGMKNHQMVSFRVSCLLPFAQLAAGPWANVPRIFRAIDAGGEGVVTEARLMQILANDKARLILPVVMYLGVC